MSCEQLLREAGPAEGSLQLSPACPGVLSAPRVPESPCGRPMCRWPGGPPARTPPLPGATHGAVGPHQGLVLHWLGGRGGGATATQQVRMAVYIGTRPRRLATARGSPAELGAAPRVPGGPSSLFWFQIKGRKVRACSGAPVRSLKALRLGDTSRSSSGVSPRLWD